MGWGKPWFDINQYTCATHGPAPWYVPLTGDPASINCMSVDGGAGTLDLAADMEAMGGMPSNLLWTNIVPDENGEIDFYFDVKMDGQQTASPSSLRPDWYMEMVLAYVPTKWKDALDIFSTWSPFEIELTPEAWVGTPYASDWVMGFRGTNTAFSGAGAPTVWPPGGVVEVTPWLGVWYTFHLHIHKHGWWANVWPRAGSEPGGGGMMGETWLDEVQWPTSDGTLPGFNAVGPQEMDTLTFYSTGQATGYGTLYIDNVCWGPRGGVAAPVVFGGGGYP
jgi:hypothetical protein